MRDVSKLKFIGKSFCSQYQSQAKFYIDEAHASGKRHLVVVYENGEPDFMPAFLTDGQTKTCRTSSSGR